MDFVSYVTSVAVFAHFALFFYVIGFLTRSEIWLRLQILAGSIFYILYYYFVADDPLWEAIGGTIAIIIANMTIIGVIFYERSTAGMNRQMLELYRSFPTLNPGQFRRIMKFADWVTVDEAQVLTTQHKRPDHLFLVSAGTMLLKRGDKTVKLGAGNFVGEISFLIEGPATATVIAQPGATFVRWHRKDLTDVMDRSPRLANAISSLFNKDIARKLAVSWPEDVT